MVRNTHDKGSAMACLQAGRNCLEEKERDSIWVDKEKFHDGGGVFGGKRRKRKKETENIG